MSVGLRLCAVEKTFHPPTRASRWFTRRRSPERETVALDAVSLSIAPSEFFVIMGRSGSGKSTLLRCINRLVEPTGGRIWLDDVDVTRLGPTQLRALRRGRIAMVFQHFGLFEHRSVRDNVGYALRVQGRSRDERRRKVDEMLRVVGLEAWAEHSPRALSGGMRQRVGLARALASGADLLLMDEPFSALDPPARREMRAQLRRLHESLRPTIVFVTHDPDEARELADRVAFLHNGRLERIIDGRDLRSGALDSDVAAFLGGTSPSEAVWKVQAHGSS